MVQQRAAGNGNFDIDAIRMAANVLENTPAVIHQPFVDPVADAFAADVDDMVDELRFNPSSNLAEEAQQIMNSPLAARLGAGVMADLRAAVQLQDEKAANGADAFTRGDRVWEERKEQETKNRKALDDADEYADKVQNVGQQEQQRQERAEAWANSDHTYAGQKMSASEWLRIIHWFKQPENRAAWEDAMMAKTGQTREQVRATGDKIDRLDSLIEKESRGETLSPEEIAERDRLNRDHAVQQGIETRTTMADPNLAKSAEMNNENGAQVIEVRADSFAVADRAVPISPHTNPSLKNEATERNDASNASPSVRATDAFAGASVARELDQAVPQGERLNATFARAATGELPATQTAPQVAVAAARPTANFDANAGMI